VKVNPSSSQESSPASAFGCHWGSAHARRRRWCTSAHPLHRGGTEEQHAESLEHIAAGRESRRSGSYQRQKHRRQQHEPLTARRSSNARRGQAWCKGWPNVSLEVDILSGDLRVPFSNLPRRVSSVKLSRYSRDASWFRVSSSRTGREQGLQPFASIVKPTLDGSRRQAKPRHHVGLAEVEVIAEHDRGSLLRCQAVERRRTSSRSSLAWTIASGPADRSMSVARDSSSVGAVDRRDVVHRARLSGLNRPR
jgi:hypothetical protein